MLVSDLTCGGGRFAVMIFEFRIVDEPPTSMNLPSKINPPELCGTCPLIAREAPDAILILTFVLPRLRVELI